MTIRTSPRFWIFGLILSIHFLKMAGGAWGEPISFNEYQSRIQSAIEYLESEEWALQGDDISYLRGLFPSGLMVQNMRGERVRADHQGLLRWAQEEDGGTGDRDELRTHLKSLLKQLSWPVTRGETIRGSPAWEEKRSRLDEVYEAGEFRHLKEKRTPPWKAYVGELLRALGKWLQKHLPLGPNLPGKWAQYPLYGFILILGGILIVWIFRSVGPIGWRWRETKIRLSQGVKAPEKDWLTWRGQALSKAQRGAFREAIRSLFVSALMEGHQRGWWVYEPETTNREHLARVEGPVERRQALQKLIDLYEESWYGLGHPGREEFRKCQEWLQQMGKVPSKMGKVPSKVGKAPSKMGKAQ